MLIFAMGIALCRSRCARGAAGCLFSRVDTVIFVKMFRLDRRNLNGYALFA